MTKKKILNVVSYLPPYGAGGAERTTKLHSEILEKNGWEVMIATLNHGNMDYQINKNIKIQTFSKNLELKIGEQINSEIYSNIIFVIRFTLFLINIIKKNNIEIIHSQSHDLFVPSYIASIITGIKLNAFIRDCSYVCEFGAICLTHQEDENLIRKCTLNHKFEYAFKKRKSIINKILFSLKYFYLSLFFKIKRKILLKSDKIVFISHGIKNVYMNIIEKKYFKKFYVAYCPAVKINYKKVKTEKIINLVNKIKSNKGKIILYVGKFSFGKGAEIIKSVSQKISQHKENFHIIIAGNKTIDLKIENENIHFTNFIDQNDLSYLYENCDVVFVPSIWPEPLGWANLDSAMYSKPIVSSKVGGIPEVVIHNETGFLFQKKDHDQAYNFLKKILNDDTLSSKFGNNASLHVKKKFGEEAILNQLMEIYN